MPLIIGGVSAASGLISGITGLFQKNKGKKLLKNLHYPTETIPQELLQNQQQARINANVGMPSEQYNQAMRNIQRQQLMALRGAQDRRGRLAVLGGLQQGANDALLKLDSENAQQRLNNQRALYGINTQVANTRRDLFDKNVRQKYIQDYNYAQGLIGAGNQNFVGGLDKITSGAGQAIFRRRNGLYGSGTYDYGNYGASGSW